MSASAAVRSARPRATLPVPSRNSVIAAALLLALLAAGLWSFRGVGLSWEQLARGTEYAGQFLARTVPFVWPTVGETVRLSALTLAIVFCGTALAAILSIPVAVLAARNTTPWRGGGALGRFLGVTARAAPDAIMAMIFALVIGQGALAGVLALGIHSIGMISKLTADAIEQIDEGPVRALRAAGASRAQQFWGGIWPQVLPAYIAIVLHRADINLRVSVILGFVGVAGLGQQLSHAMQTLNYREAMPFAVIIFVLCVAFEVVSALIRRALLGAQPTGRGLGHRLVRRVTSAPAAKAGAARAARIRQSRLRLGRAGRIPWTPDRLRQAGLIWGTAAVLAVSIGIAATQGSSFAYFWKNLGIAAARLWPPSLAPEKWGDVALALLETVQIAFAATLFAVVFSALLGAFAARNVAPNPGVRAGARFTLIAIRGLPELLLALFFIILTGLGPGAAVLALGIGGIGLLGKLVADSLEEVRPGPERALTAVGATRTQVFAAATFPQAVPAFVGHTLYLLDTNVRSATVLGIVGGGGIGYMLASAARINQHELLFLLLCVLAIVFLLEGLSSWLRRLLA
ncbi:phosphonate ABC transporter, permease protein PhnE [Leucobacter triazinivorans]|uniref:phosphonate ABC transporter, permease protein PhnE n=1 Tax=Leucobacter triazinivorans TaxID=1784719 RepID=UPI001F0D28BD|nr:phosphonate ABC transporter, permease protein PhnE [Leucobacter triazinivorans]